jgi:hypothetical protein
MSNRRGQASSRALGDSLAAQVAALARHQTFGSTRPGSAPTWTRPPGSRTGAQKVADVLDAASPRGPAAPYWTGLDREMYATQVADPGSVASCGVISRTAAASAVSHLCLLRPGDVRHDQRTPTRAAAAMRSLPSSHSDGCCLPFAVMS